MPDQCEVSAKDVARIVEKLERLYEAVYIDGPDGGPIIPRLIRLESELRAQRERRDAKQADSRIRDGAVWAAICVGVVNLVAMMFDILVRAQAAPATP